LAAALVTSLAPMTKATSVEGPGIRVLTYAEDYEGLFGELARQQKALGEEMRATERFQDTQRKLSDEG